jgi:hypothetical protein
VDTLPIPIVPVPLALSVRASLEPELVTDRATPPAAAADFTFSPVADKAVDASTLKAGLVAPLSPTARAFAEAEVMATAPPSVTAPAILAVVPTYKAFAQPIPPEVIMEPVPTEVESVVSVEDIPAIKGMREVVVVCPSLVMAVDRPVPRSAVSVLKVVELMTVPVTTGCPAVFIKNVPEPLYDILLLLNSVFYYVIYMVIDMD